MTDMDAVSPSREKHARERQRPTLSLSAIASLAVQREPGQVEEEPSMSRLPMIRPVAAVQLRQLLPALALATLLTAVLVRAGGAQVIDPTFPMVNGSLGHLFPLGDTLYVGGDFTWMGAGNGSCVALDAVTGDPVTPWPRVQAGLLGGIATRLASAAVPDGAGGCYVTGSFEAVSGVPRFRLAHLRGDGSVDGWNAAIPPGWSPLCIARTGSRLFVGGYLDESGHNRPLVGAIDIASGNILWTAASAGGRVSALTVRGAMIYAGGSFTSLGGQPRSNIAAINPGTGLASGWDPGADGAVLALAASDSIVFAGGAFMNAGGAARVGVAALDPTTGQARSWDTQVGSPQVTALALAGPTLYIGGSFYAIGGQAHGPLAAVDASTGAPLPWNPFFSGGVNTLLAGGQRLYVGGSLWTNVSLQATHLAAFDALTGIQEPWETDADQAVVGLALEDGRLFAMGAAACGGRQRLHAASIDLATGRVTDWDPHPDRPVAAYAKAGNTLYVGGYFAQIAGQPRNGIAAFDRTTGALLPWNPAAGLSTVQVKHMALHGRTLVVDGWAGSWTQSSVLAGIDLDGGSAAWTTSVTGGQFFEISELLMAGTKAFVLGDFNTVNGITRRSAAALDAGSGALAVWDAQLSGWCATGVAVGDVILLWGSLGTVAGLPSGATAFVDTTSGALVARPAPGTGGFPNTLAVDGTTLYVGGSDQFTGLEPYPQTEAWALDVETSAVLPWSVGITRRLEARLEGTSSIAARAGEVWLAGDFNLARDATRHGLAQVLPADGTAPVVSAQPPAGGPLAVGSTHTLAWTAADDQRVLSEDLYLSRSGPSGPWELLAGGLEGVSAYDWTATGPASSDCWLRVDARDLAGNQGTATTPAGFAIADTTSTLAVGATIPLAGIALAPPTPTPARVRAWITYDLPARATVSLTLFDLQGREVAVLDRGARGPGRQGAAIDASRLPPGLYLLRLQADRACRQRRLLVVR